MEVTESFPFDEKTLVFKVAGKIFALTGLDNHPLQINLKCNPEKAIELRENFECVQPGYHMNKKHWNTVIVNESVNDSLLIEWIDHSYDCVIAGLPKVKREHLKNKE